VRKVLEVVAEKVADRHEGARLQSLLKNSDARFFRNLWKPCPFKTSEARAFLAQSLEAAPPFQIHIETAVFSAE
jgi:hypothetical protein